MVIAPVISEFGQDFTESSATCWVTTDIAELDRLLAIAQKRKNIYEDNQLLRQIDIVGLIGLLQGIPVDFTVKKQKEIEDYKLLSIEMTSKENKLFLPPTKCGNLQQDEISQPEEKYH